MTSKFAKLAVACLLCLGVIFGLVFAIQRIIGR
jgi:hypothetical protein